MSMYPTRIWMYPEKCPFLRIHPYSGWVHAYFCGYIHIRVGYMGMSMYPTRIWMYPDKMPIFPDTSIFGLGTWACPCTQPEYGCIRKNAHFSGYIRIRVGYMDMPMYPTRIWMYPQKCAFFRIHPYSGWLHGHAHVPNPNMDVS